MKKIINLIFTGIALLGCTNTPEGASPLKEAGVMPSFETGFEQGVSACYAALCNDTLYIAGGCNFPDTPAAQGGAKRYYRGIYKAAAGDTLIWQQAGLLPAHSAYGAYIQHGNKLFIAGGMNSNGATADVFCIHLADECRIDTLPSLPCTIDNTAGAVSGNHLFIVGGNANGKPSRKAFMLNIENPTEGWSTLPDMPSRARVQPVCAATSHAIYVWGGFTPTDSSGNALVHTDGLRYNLATDTWNTLPELTIDNTPVTLSGAVAILTNDSTIIAAGGVDKEIFTDAISGAYRMTDKADYMLHPAEWYRFNPRLLQYDTRNDIWRQLHIAPTLARAGAAMATDGNKIYYIGGELKPGIRTPSILKTE